MRFTGLIFTALLISSLAFAQTGAGGGAVGGPATNGTKTLEQQREELARLQQEQFSRAEREGVEVRIKDIARFRGHRVNMLSGFGIVVGLAGTGDSQQTPFAATMIKNALERWGANLGEASFRPKNVALVSVTAELPPYAAPGNMIDITVSSAGDAKSLAGGTLLLTPLYGPSDNQSVIALAQGSIGTGGFSASGSGSSSSKNHVNAGRIPSGAIVEQSVDTQLVFDGNRIYLELYAPDLTTSQRIATALAEKFPEFFVTPVDGGTISIRIPEGFSSMLAMSQIEQSTVFADVPAVVIVNERTGTVVIGGNVKLGPAVIAHGSLKIRIDTYPVISQPNPFGQGNTVSTSEATVNAEETPAQIAAIPPSTTINDLAAILQALELSASDIVAILNALKDAGALKAKVVSQ